MWGQEVGRLAVSAGCPPPAVGEGSAPAARGPWAWDKGTPRRRRAGSCYRDPRGSGTITKCDRPTRLRLPPPPLILPAAHLSSHAEVAGSWLAIPGPS